MTSYIVLMEPSFGLAARWCVHAGSAWHLTNCSISYMVLEPYVQSSTRVFDCMINPCVCVIVCQSYECSTGVWCSSELAAEWLNMMQGELLMCVRLL